MEPYEIWRGRTVDKRCGITKSTRYREISRGRFPKPIQLTERCVGYRSDEVMAWLESRERARTGEISAA